MPSCLFITGNQYPPPPPPGYAETVAYDRAPPAYSYNSHYNPLNPVPGATASYNQGYHQPIRPVAQPAPRQPAPQQQAGPIVVNDSLQQQRGATVAFARESSSSLNYTQIVDALPASICIVHHVTYIHD